MFFVDWRRAFTAEWRRLYESLQSVAVQSDRRGTVVFPVTWPSQSRRLLPNASPTTEMHAGIYTRIYIDWLI